jgi:integration host factor subunit alpha
MPNLTITRAEVTESVIRQIGLTRQEASDLLDRTLELIGQALETEDEVKLSRFGNFVVRSKAPREGRNPKTGEEALIAARRVVTFRPSPMLKARVSESASRTD